MSAVVGGHVVADVSEAMQNERFFAQFMQSMGVLATLFMDEEIGARARQLSSEVTEGLKPEEWVRALVDESKAQAMDELIEYGYPWHRPSDRTSPHSQTEQYWAGAGDADDTWRGIFTGNRDRYRKVGAE